jgi:hypothetical protein
MGEIRVGSKTGESEGIMNILDDKYVRRYFRHCDDQTHDCDGWRSTISEAVLKAMQEPIRKGERYLLIDCEIICEKIAESNTLDHGKHLGSLRLPDRFQTAGKDCQHGKLCRCQLSAAGRISAPAGAVRGFVGWIMPMQDS